MKHLLIGVSIAFGLYIGLSWWAFEQIHRPLTKIDIDNCDVPCSYFGGTNWIDNYSFDCHCQDGTKIIPAE